MGEKIGPSDWNFGVEVRIQRDCNKCSEETEEDHRNERERPNQKSAGVTQVGRKPLLSLEMW